MTFETDRLILRPWRESDAESLYEYAKNPLVGPIAGWPVHTSVENSLEIIRTVLASDGNYAITLKNEDKAIGSIGLMFAPKANTFISAGEAEIGYWIGQPYWGLGYVPEAARELMKYAFNQLNVTKLWCGYFDGNEKSKRVSEKCGFSFYRTEKNKPWTAMNTTKDHHLTCITKQQ